ncbi:MAG TPA: thioredoxin [Candidatus Galloscillospira stercoripullorum]|nr:thioredoxin [Candidatus Galloscillospira stercoripullorum]
MKFLRSNAPAVVLLSVGILFLLLGIWRGEPGEVLRKAVTICMECIGLG